MPALRGHFYPIAKAQPVHARRAARAPASVQAINRQPKRLDPVADLRNHAVKSLDPLAANPAEAKRRVQGLHYDAFAPVRND